MNPTIKVIEARKSVREYEERAIPEELKQTILHAALRAPTAGNMMLYSIIEITLQETKDRLVETCDNQPFIASAPLVLLFLADYQRWMDYFDYSAVSERCAELGEPLVVPEEGDLMLSACDALIAAQTAVIAAESLGIGSCYIGDILENYEAHRQMFDLPRYAVPICLLCFGYPTQAARQRKMTGRFPADKIVFQDHYRRLDRIEFEEMFALMEARARERGNANPDIGWEMYRRKFSADYAVELRRSVMKMFDSWRS
ncbi:MAG: nitroreductase family protein [Anaerolineales bacterium]|jgi:FMN reductase (NADPH)/FMN reductase [NAD(P)H]